MTGPPPTPADPVQDFIDHGPFGVQALCLECGAEYRAWVVSRKAQARLSVTPKRWGECPGCTEAEARALGALTAPERAEEPVPSMAEVRAAFDGPDPDDPFDGRKDLG